VLDQKASESEVSAKNYFSKCLKVQEQSVLLYPAGGRCEEALRNPPLRDLVAWKNIRNVAAPQSDPQEESIVALQEEVFFTSKSDRLLALSKEYYDRSHWWHAAATAAYGTAAFADLAPDFRAVLGCSVGRLGLWNEALFHLKSASNYDGLKDNCIRAVRAEGGAKK
jgi:hypothetical protein